MNYSIKHTTSSGLGTSRTQVWPIKQIPIPAASHSVVHLPLRPAAYIVA